MSHKFLKLDVVVEALIDHPIAEVFPFVSDVRNDPKWVNTVSVCEQIQGNGVDIGARYRFIHAPGGFGPFEGTYQVEEVDPPRLIRWTAIDRNARWDMTMRFESVEGGTWINQHNLSSWRGIPWFARPIMHFLTRRQLKRQFRDLSHVLQQIKGQGISAGGA